MNGIVPESQAPLMELAAAFGSAIETELCACDQAPEAGPTGVQYSNFEGLDEEENGATAPGAAPAPLGEQPSAGTPQQQQQAPADAPLANDTTGASDDKHTIDVLIAALGGEAAANPDLAAQLRAAPPSLVQPFRLHEAPAAACGAVLRLPPGLPPEQATALLRELYAPRREGEPLLLLHHLGAAGVALPPQAQRLLLWGAAAAEEPAGALGGPLRQWACLCSLDASACGLGTEFLAALLDWRAAQLRGRLRYLDLSRNPGLGAPPGGRRGGGRDAREAAAAELAVVRLLALRGGLLWEGAPLQHLGLAHTGLGAAALARLMQLLAASAAGPAAAALRSLELGPPGDMPAFPPLASGGFVDQLRGVMAACPCLSHLRVHGLSEEQAAALAAAWQAAQAARGRAGHRVDAGPGGGLLLSLSQDGELPVLPPVDHVLPPPPTPEPTGAAAAGSGPAPTPVPLDLAAAAEWEAEGLGQQPAAERRRQQQQQQQEQQQLAPHPLGGLELTAAPRLPGQQQHARRRRRVHAGSGGGGIGGHAHRGQGGAGHRQRTLHGWVVPDGGSDEDAAHAYSSSGDDDDAPGEAPAAAWPGSSAAASAAVRRGRGGGGGARRPPRSPRMYRGGRREDDLALHDPGQLLGSEEQEWEDSEADLDYHELEEREAAAASPGDSGRSSGPGGRRRGEGGSGAQQRQALPPAARPPLRLQEKFTMGAHELYNDDVAAKHFKRSIRRIITEIQDKAARKRAMRSFVRWRDDARWPFDRRRWTNKSKTSNGHVDDPLHLYHFYVWQTLILEHTGASSGFPFPPPEEDAANRRRAEAAAAAQGLQPIWVPGATAVPQQQQQQQRTGRLQLRHAPAGAPPPPLDDSQEAGPGGGGALRPHALPRVQCAVVGSSDEEEEEEEEEEQEEAGPAGLPKQQREQGGGAPRRAARRFLDDGGRGRGSDAEQASGPDSFINDGPSSSDGGASSSSEEGEDDERRPLAVRLAAGWGGTGCKRRRASPGGGMAPDAAGPAAASPSVVYLLSESENQEQPPPPGPESHAAGVAAGQQRELARVAAEEEEEEQQQQQQQAAQTCPRRRRYNELVSLQPFYYDPHREEHPASAQHFGLVEGRRPRRRPAAYAGELREGDDDLAAVLAEIEAMEAKDASRQAGVEQQQQQNKLPRRRAARAAVEHVPVGEAGASSSSDEDAPLVAPQLALRLRSGTPAAPAASTAAAAAPAAGASLHAAGQQQRPTGTPQASPSPSWLPSISPVSPSDMQPAAAAGPTPPSVRPNPPAAAEEKAAVVPADQGQPKAAEQPQQQPPRQPDPAVIPDSEEEE